MSLNDSLFLDALVNTLWMACGAALLAPMFFSLVPYVGVRTRLPGRAALDFLSWLPRAIPGTLLGLGLLWVFLGTPVFRPLYETISVLILATVIGSMTLGTQIIKGGLQPTRSVRKARVSSRPLEMNQYKVDLVRTLARRTLLALAS